MFNTPDIHITDRGRLERKLRDFSPQSISVRADFDGTITKPIPTSWQLLEQLDPHLPGYNAKSLALYNEYHPYMHNITEDPAIVQAKMQEWWTKALSLFREFNLHSHHLDTISVDHVELRDGIPQAFSTLEKWGVPVLVLSAGVGQMIDKILTRHDLVRDHVSIKANTLTFNPEQGMFDGVSPERPIHASNKHDHITPHHQSPERSNIILLGDNPQDMSMIHPSERDSTIAIGFCNAGQLGVFRDLYDVTVVSPDSDRGVLQQILETIDR